MNLVPETLRGEKNFRWRGGAVSRIEALSDAVFALALTLLVVTLDVPRSFGEIAAAFEQLPAFAACFAILVMCWFFHYPFHRRYGLEDGVTIALNALLLLGILVYVYPLRFVFTLLFAMFFGLGPPVSAGPGLGLRRIEAGEWPTRMALYSAGFAAIFLLLALLTANALRRRRDLEFDAKETAITRLTLRSHLISMGFGFASIALVAFAPTLTPWAGALYFLLGPVQALHGWRSGEAIERSGKR